MTDGECINISVTSSDGWPVLFHLCSFPRLDVHDPDTRGRLMDRIDQAIEELALDRCKCPRYTIVFTTAGDWREDIDAFMAHTKRSCPLYQTELRLHVGKAYKRPRRKMHRKGTG